MKRQDTFKNSGDATVFLEDLEDSLFSLKLETWATITDENFGCASQDALVKLQQAFKEFRQTLDNAC